MGAAFFDRRRAHRSPYGRELCISPPILLVCPSECWWQCPRIWASRPAAPALPAHCPLAIVCLACSVAQAGASRQGDCGNGLESLGLLPPLHKLLIKDIPGMTEPCVLQRLAVCGLGALAGHTAAPAAGTGLAVWHQPPPM